MILELAMPGQGPTASMGPVIRALRIARVLRLIRKFRGLARLFQTMFAVLPALANVAALLCLFLYIYTCLGLGLYGKVGPYDEMEAMDANVNFQFFGPALLTCVGMATGELWETLIFDVASKAPGCVPSQSYRDFLEN